MHEEHAPHSFVTKILTLPHLRGVIAGTGSFELILQWYLTMQRSLMPDLAWTGDHAPAELRRLAASMPEAQSTVYHFAWTSERFEGFGFASRDRFAARPLARNSVVVKPEYAGVHGDAAVDRAEIGGEVHVVNMTSEHIIQTIAYRFPDYDALYAQMCSRLG
jgi:hypothetical protein